ncbi:hypothetical protein L5M28_07260 [Shewanella sp. SW32]|uniref:hypothetical protein n=1 Tax=unclassified Shewanella TaxID=196818 RepID=UPI0021DAB723|nr:MULTISPECIES: hypothetical protein [unclassified Shewanella]MCU7962375.1 hypothetical protein [Shewanella sp. SW32]MCU7971284.1 hypothetical protein [Shewanella sp. SW29]
MKITDEELMQCIWQMQLRKVTTGVLTRYVGDEYAVSGEKCDTEFLYASSMKLFNREHLTSVICKSQLLFRLRYLARQKLIKMDSRTFYIDTPEAREAYQLARQWWLDHGVPTGYDREHNCMRCIKLPNYNDMVELCIAHLHHYFNQQGLRGAA